MSVISGVLEFGAGVLIGRPTTGNTATLTPREFGVLQDGQITVSGDLKELHGQLQFPVAKARGKMKIQGKAKAAAFDINAYSDLFFGLASTTGSKRFVYQEAGTVASATVTVAHVGTPFQDYGVTYASGANAGKAFDKVASAPAVGQYSVNLGTGVYTFNAGDNAAAVVISYSYTDGALGKTLLVTNQLMGFAPEWEAILFVGFRGKQTLLRVANCTTGKWDMATKLEDFIIPEFDFTGAADASGNVLEFAYDIN